MLYVFQFVLAPVPWAHVPEGNLLCTPYIVGATESFQLGTAAQAQNKDHFGDG